MKFNLATYGDELLVEAEEISDESYQRLKEALPPETQCKLIGWRRVASLPYATASF